MKNKASRPASILSLFACPCGSRKRDLGLQSHKQICGHWEVEVGGKEWKQHINIWPAGLTQLKAASGWISQRPGTLSQFCGFAQVCDGCLQGSFPAGWVCFPPSSSEKVRVLLLVILPSPPSPPLLCQDNGFSDRSPLLGSRPLSQLSHWDIFPHFQDYDHFNLDLCVLPPHTKKHSGTGLVGLEEIHICPVQAIGIQSFTLSNATKREKRSWELALPFSTSMKRTVLSFSFF